MASRGYIAYASIEAYFPFDLAMLPCTDTSMVSLVTLATCGMELAVEFIQYHS
jgi:hypothetical protein